MKRVIRAYVYATFSLWAVSEIAEGIVFEKGLESLLLAGIGLMIALLVGRPIINILLLPINLITFGLFRWVSSAIALYLVTLVIPGFQVAGFHYGGLNSKWFDIPELSFKGVIAYVAFSFLLSLIISFIYWIRK
jgi:putative membrane protein